MATDLNWLKDVKPVETEVRKAPRGRQPGDNPVEHFVETAHSTGKAQAFSVPADVAGRVERMLRRAGTVKGRDWSVSVQVLDADPALTSTTGENVIPLRAVKDLKEGTDVWLSVTASDKATETKDETPAPAAEAKTTDADPFAGTPAGTDPAPVTEPKKSSRFVRNTK